MADWNLNSTLLAGMQVLECLTEGDGAATYLVKQISSEQKYIYKTISVPASQTQVDGLRYSGAIQTSGEAQAYYERVVADYRSELEALKRLSECGSIEGYKAYQILPKEDGVGFDIHLLASYKTTLTEYMRQSPMTHLKAVNLAMDLCGALTDLRQAGYIHCNIKPENIYLNSQGHFMLGDLGLFRKDQLKYAAVPEHMLGKFSAPELFDIMQMPNETSDIYTVGLILYDIFNGGHRPFEDEKTSTKGASEKRLSGTPLPAPIYADYELAGILTNACAFAPENRFQTPEALREMLKDYAQRNEPQDIIIVPPIITDGDTLLTEEAMNEQVQPVQFVTAEDLDAEFVANFAPDTESLSELVDAIIQEETQAAEGTQAQTQEDPAKPEVTVPAAAGQQTTATPAKKSGKKALIAIAAAIAVLIVTLTGGYFLLLPEVNSITAEPSGTNSIVLTLDTDRRLSAFSATCTDTYGNSFTATEVEGRLQFSGLNPGTQYTVRLDTVSGLPIRGESTVMATTTQATEILHFTAQAVSESQVELSFTIAGQDQENWVVRYGTENGITMETQFTGHCVIISDLEPNNLYTFSLINTETLSLTGNIQTKYDTTVRVKVDEILNVTRADSITLQWTYSGEAPESWSVTCHGPDNFLVEQTVTEPAATFTGLELEKVYTFEIFCVGMATAAEKTVRTAEATITGLTAELNEDGKTVLSWTSDVHPEGGWLILCSLDENHSVISKIQTEDTSVVLTSLLPESSYSVEIQTGTGLSVNGDSTTQLTTQANKKFSSYGLTASYLGMFAAPPGDNWTYRNLAIPRNSYAASETVAFAMESLTRLSSSQNSVDVCIAVRNSSGVIDSVNHYSKSWDSLWDNKMFVGTPERTPQTSGSYTLEVYFNGELVNTGAFTVT